MDRRDCDFLWLRLCVGAMAASTLIAHIVIFLGQVKE